MYLGFWSSPGGTGGEGHRLMVNGLETILGEHDETGTKEDNYFYMNLLGMGGGGLNSLGSSQHPDASQRGQGPVRLGNWNWYQGRVQLCLGSSPGRAAETSFVEPLSGGGGGWG